MKKNIPIPTAQEFAMKDHEGGSSIYKMTPAGVRDMLIKFAKLHVQQALIAASEKVKLEPTDPYDVHKKKEINKESILNSYPLDNIK